jgi:hypothetical protein
MMIFIVWTTLALIIGLMGANRKFGFWGYFFASLFFTPFLGLMLMLASDKIYRGATQGER